MKKIIFILLTNFVYVFLSAQIPLSLVGEDQKGKKIESIELVNTDPEAIAAYSWKVQYNLDGKREINYVARLKSFKYQINNLTDFWQDQCIKNDVYENLFKKGPQYDLRQDLEIESLNYLEKLRTNNLLFEDSYLENYLYSLVYKIYPGTINDGRPGIVSVKIEQDTNPNAYICPNGTMLITRLDCCL